MINKAKSLNKKDWCIIAGVFTLIIILATVACLVLSRNTDKNPVLESIKDVEVTEAEMREYRERIGTDMDIKKSYLILFEDEESCRKFIETNGADDDPTAAGIGIIPLMEDGYYNIVGKQSLEDAFDSLSDGEYSKEPIVYSNMYCYLKRIGVDSPIKDDKALEEFIKNEKYQEMRKRNE